jgi:hypothetical protein
MRKRLLPVIPIAVALVMSAGAGERMPGGSERTPRLRRRDGSSCSPGRCTELCSGSPVVVVACGPLGPSVGAPCD